MYNSLRIKIYGYFTTWLIFYKWNIGFYCHSVAITINSLRILHKDFTSPCSMALSTPSWNWISITMLDSIPSRPLLRRKLRYQYKFPVENVNLHFKLLKLLLQCRFVKHARERERESDRIAVSTSEEYYIRLLASYPDEWLILSSLELIRFTLMCEQAKGFGCRDFFAEGMIY